MVVTQVLLLQSDAYPRVELLTAELFTERMRKMHIGEGEEEDDEMMMDDDDDDDEEGGGVPVLGGDEAPSGRWVAQLPTL